MDREVEEATFAGDENEMTTESGYNHLQSEFFITSSISSVDNNNIAYNSDEVVSSNIGHHHNHAHHSSNMYLHTTFGDTFFIKSFTTSSHLETFYVCLFMFFLAIIYNSLKSYQHHLNQKRPSFDEATCYPVAEKFSESDSTDNGNHHQFKTWIKFLLSMQNVLDTFIHTLLVAIGYSLMLAIMSFNVWILVAVVSGEAIGYFIFGYTRRIQSGDVNQGDNSCFFLQTCSGNFDAKEPK